MRGLLTLGPRRSRRAAAAILVVGAVALRTASSQPEPSAPRDPVRETVARVQEIQSLEGPNSPALIEPLTALAVLYREQGDRDLALAAIERARRIVRGTYGLYSLEEAPLLRELLAAERASGNAKAAWELEQDLLRLVDKDPGNLRTVPILRDLGDSRVAILRHYVSGENPPEITLGCYYQWFDKSDECDSGPFLSTPTNALLFETQSYYARAAQTLVSQAGWTSTELPELWMTCVRTAYEFRDVPTRWEATLEAHHAAGEDCLRQIAVHAGRNSYPPPAQMDALVQIADWRFLFARVRRAKVSVLEIYEQTYATFEEQGLDSAAIGELFSPALPVVLPAFLPNPLASAEPATPAGHIDIGFDVTPYGDADRVEIVAATPDVTREAKDRLVGVVKRSLFRPRTTDGRFEAASHVVVRYFVGGG